MNCRILRALGTLLAAASIGVAQDLTELSLEDLLDIQVTSVSKKAQALSRTPAAAFVLTHEDIRRSGMTNIPDLLRLVPGVNVAQTSANSWAVTARGFNDRYASKVLVMIDGRSIYTSEFSGVFWEQWNVPIEDIDRIEVIRGSGGTVWGANAMNGVINIITKSSAQTQGGLLAAGGGSRERAQTHLRYGGTIGDNGTYRLFGRYLNVKPSEYRDGAPAYDSWTGQQFGFRTDWTLSPNDTLMAEGDVTANDLGQRVTLAGENEGWSMRSFDEIIEAKTHSFLTRWDHVFRDGSQARVQVFHAHSRRTDRGIRHSDATDGEAQYRFTPAKRHDIVAGIGFRHFGVNVEPEKTFRYDQRALAFTLASAFVQDEVSLAKAWTLTLGSKFERNSFTGFEFEPSGQLMWSPNEQKAAWFSVSRAIRQPSFTEYHSIIDLAVFPAAPGLTGIVRLRGNRDVTVEQMLSFEAGFRTALGPRFTLDTAVFRSRYDDLLTSEEGSPYLEYAQPPYLVVPATFGNRASARNYGGEILSAWQATDSWRLTASYSFLQMKVRRHPDSNDAGVEGTAGNSPKHLWQVRSSYKLTRNLEWDANAFYVSALNTRIANVPDYIPSYVRLDARLAWRPLEPAEFSITGQNLLSSRRSEFPSPYLVSATEVQRAIFAKVVWTF